MFTSHSGLQLDSYCPRARLQTASSVCLVFATNGAAAQEAPLRSSPRGFAAATSVPEVPSSRIFARSSLSPSPLRWCLFTSLRVASREVDFIGPRAFGRWPKVAPPTVPSPASKEEGAQSNRWRICSPDV